ncbi:xanthine dehydrogenase small subunit [Bythopirellula goksoeyrii]|uniref:Nicotinate dehydrogenase FAD-subunit n=1 Tax=Bythopirellula goksoeyrii TaxID=1400387 RepID=A0A5B9QJP4_9BACT|nr:FAD binding domain-containing protein [Bythopirellula goksoeyrii]QEG37266.1 Nicotinate dehydrogenase FAD-subunit [Bythopirellula goksoeyrii]
MRDFLLLYINGVRHQIHAHQARMSLSDFLRRELGQIGTKIVCSEGDCGACSVLVGRVHEDGLRYEAIDSCIAFLFQLDSTHIVTVEGLAKAGSMNDVQQALVDCHGSQCGFCTPGFAMAMTAMQENDCSKDADSMRTGLTGNLCRCTGYVSILEAGLTAELAEGDRMDVLYPSEPMLQDFYAHSAEDIALIEDSTPPLLKKLSSPASISTNGQGKGFAASRVLCPVTLASALEVLREWPQSMIVAGATDIGVRVNKGQALPETILDLNRVKELEQLGVVDGKLVMGARASWTEVESLCRQQLEEFYQIVKVFGAPQIRNMGTVGGNVINASPIADSLPFYFVMDAELELRSAEGSRTVNINDFYQGYKKFDLQPGELLTRVTVPLPDEGELLRLFKVSRRLDLDISSFTAAIRIRLDGSRIAEAALAFGAVGPTVLRARNTEDFLVGREFSEATMREAGELAVAEVTPISDVRGSEDYRLQLTRNVFVKFYLEHQPDAVLL